MEVTILKNPDPIKQTETWIKKLFHWLLLNLGWTISGIVPEQKKCIIIVAPHTSNIDFFLGIALKFATGVKANFLAKEILFQSPWGWIFYKLGGYPVKRDKHYNQVDHIVSIINKEEHFVLGIAPEGTRSDSGQWKTGFYWIAKLAKIPIIMVSFDYSKKHIIFSKPYYPTRNMQKDFSAMKFFFKDAKGIHHIKKSGIAKTNK
jgi:1-acyl-sn-glycerol-3-phosphate acyltransferase